MRVSGSKATPAPINKGEMPCCRSFWPTRMPCGHDRHQLAGAKDPTIRRPKLGCLHPKYS